MLKLTRQRASFQFLYFVLAVCKLVKLGKGASIAEAIEDGDAYESLTRRGLPSSVGPKKDSIGKTISYMEGDK